jgi:DNA-binding beta-propeller fold protein YncE
MKLLFRTLRVLAITGGLMQSAWVGAQTASVFQQSLRDGLGAFSSAGNVTLGSEGATLKGSLLGKDGALTSTPISTSGYTNVTLSYDRVTAGLVALYGDGGIVEYAVNGGAFQRLEVSRVTSTSRASFVLPQSASNSSVTLRFRLVSLTSRGAFTVGNVSLTGDSGSGGSGGNAQAPAIAEPKIFESGHVRPMALSNDRSRLFVVNTPDSRIEVYEVTGAAPVWKESISVGLEPVSVAMAPTGHLWVVNHLSDSISVVDVSASPARVVNTLYVGDEPRDIVFAGPGSRWAFITAAHRGQNAPFDPQLSTAGVGRADVWVFEASSPGTALGGKPATVLNMFGDTLRGLAANADGTRVYAAVFNSGNRTTMALGGRIEKLVKTGPTASADGVTQPQTGLIVQKNANGQWMDGGDPQRSVAPTDWSSHIKLDLPDNDVFTIDTTTAVPTVVGKTAGVGTTLFNLAVNPASGKLYVSNQEARNVIRFEGPGNSSTTVNGNFVEARITVIERDNVSPRRLNKHITSYGNGLGTAAEKAAAVATPLEMAVTPDGGTLYLASMGTNKLARYATAQLENDSFTPSASNQLTLSGGLPTGVLLDAARGRVYVTTRQDNGLSVVNTNTFTEAAHVKMTHSEPQIVVSGRKFLYDASYTSSRGDSSCAGCHIFGDMDHLSWDLGNPDETTAPNGNAYNRFIPSILRTTKNFHPMKGPMNTQSFRGMAGNGPLHWRGDRQGHSSGDTLEERAFKDFSVAFPGLLGREAALTDQEMTEFARFALKLQYPPNPVARLDNSLTANQQTAMDFYMKKSADGLTTCNGCHAFDAPKGQFGTDGTMAFEGPTIGENFKIPHLRNMYQKVGMFGRNIPKAAQAGPQIRGFGYAFDGALPSVSEFLNALVFAPFVNADMRMKLEDLTLAFPSELAPIVGQQVTVTPANALQSDVSARVQLLVSRARVAAPRPECELIVKSVIGGKARGWVHSRSSDTFVPDRRGESAVSLSSLMTLGSINNAPMTFTCVAPGDGTRFGIDRNGDGVPDGG